MRRGRTTNMTGSTAFTDNPAQQVLAMTSLARTDVHTCRIRVRGRQPIHRILMLTGIRIKGILIVRGPATRYGQDQNTE